MRDVYRSAYRYWPPILVYNYSNNEHKNNLDAHTQRETPLPTALFAASFAAATADVHERPILPFPLEVKPLLW